MSGETWRVVLATGEVREVWVKRQPCGRWTAESPAHFGAEDAVTPWAAVLRLALRWTDCPREVLAPGVSSRAELMAERDAAREDHAAVEEYLAGIVAAWERASADERRMADTFVTGLRREIEEARDSGRGAWWLETTKGEVTP